MTPRYDGLRHPDRDKAIQEYANLHFGLSRSRITQILGKVKKEIIKEVRK